MHPSETARRALASDPRLRRLCERAAVPAEQVAGMLAVPGHQDDPYDIVGNGDIEGCEVVRYGRFGNNVQQLAYATAFARSQGMRWVRATGFGDLFRPGRHVLSDGLVLHLDDQHPPTGAALRGRYFFWWGLGGALRRVSGLQFGQTVRRDLAPVLAIDLDRPPTDGEALHLHLRGGDVFGREGQVSGAYVQPPLAYYTMAAEQWLARHPDGQLFVVSQDRLNPCVDALLEWAAASSHRVTFVSGSEGDDIACLVAAAEIVAGFGTFVPMIALLSQRVNRVVNFAHRQRADALEALGIGIDLVTDRAGGYMRLGEWRHSEEQRALMLTYPETALTWS